MTFTDASTGSPNAWSCTFGDGGSSTGQSPRYLYSSEGLRTASLAASNAGGIAGQSCQSVSLTARPSTTIDAGGSFSLELDGLPDLDVQNEAGCGSGPNVLQTRNGSMIATLASDFRAVTVGDFAEPSFSAGSFFRPVDYPQSLLIRSSNGAIFKAWVAANDGGGIRMESTELQASPTLPPVADFAVSSYDLFAFFSENSTRSPTGWSWTFGDGNCRAGASPDRRYASAGVYNACLTARNA